MAKMIPAQIFAETPSPGEVEIFERLAKDPNTEDWIVLHSLDIAEHTKRLAGEVDFVIIVPQKGILCLEVKASAKIRREDGLWYYGNNASPDRRGPFKQASEAMHSIRGRLTKRNDELRNILFWSAVIFPYLDFDISSGEWHSWQVIDRTGFERESISALILRVLSHARRHLIEKKAGWFDKSRNEPSLGQCRRIAEILRPDFELYESPRARIERLETEVKKYTEEQFVALDAMAANPRIVFRGPAGTGKTLLAIEAARRSLAAGNRVLFLCFNRMLGQHLESEIGSMHPNIVVSTLHSYMLNIAGINLTGEPITGDFWTNELPSLAIDVVLADSDGKYAFDQIIIDEAQDFLRNAYLDFIDLSLHGGWSLGKWMLFGDFEKQAIFESAANLTFDEALESKLGSVPQYALRVNCRNTPRITALVHLLGNLQPEYLRVLRPDDGVEPKLHYYANFSEQQQLLLEVVTELREQGYKPDEIAVLSIVSAARAVAGNVESQQGIRFATLERATKNQIGYGSIHSFKGMEKAAVIVTDVESIAGERIAALFYVAMTRALHRLHILANKSIKQDILKTIFGA
jgi:DNA polymerase III delta prime subunit